MSTHYWGKVTASNVGWFFQKTGEAWCPEHVSEWVEEWRARRHPHPILPRFQKQDD